MRPKISIPYVDNRGGTPPDLLRGHIAGMKALVLAATNTYGPLGRAASAAALPLGDRASRTWLERTRNPYREEIGRIADAVGLSGVYLLNVCFEWGCTSGVWASPEGALMRRVLDWPFPALGEHIVVVHQSGEAGEFLNATWPGVTGVYHASAPGRFAAAINQAPMREFGSGFVGDWFRSRVAVGLGDGLPPAHLLRQVFEIAPDYASAQIAAVPDQVSRASHLRSRRALARRRLCHRADRNPFRTAADGRRTRLRHQPLRGPA